LLDSLVESLPTAQILLLVNYRPEYQHSWGSKTSYTQQRLDPLSPGSAAAILQALLGDAPSLAPLTPLLIARTAGNPFFLEESVRTLIETGELVGEPGAYRLAQPLQSIQVPATVQAVLASRIDRLLPEAKRLLQTAAVIGTEVPLPLLAAMADLPDTALHRHLAQLQAAEFLYETCLFPEPEYTFKHALTHEVAYGSLLQERRRTLHARIVGTLEGLAGGRPTEQVERLAYHALRGEVWDKAVTYCQQAGARASERAAFREAVASFEHALQALGHLSEHGDLRVLVIDLHLALGDTLVPLGEYRQCLTLLEEAEALARGLDDQARLGRVLSLMALVRRITGAFDGAMVASRQALDLAVALGDRTLQVEATHRLGLAYSDLGDFGRAVELFRHNVAVADGPSGTRSLNVRLLSQAFLARTLGMLGAFAEGRRHGEEALRLATQEGHGATPILVHGFLSHLYLTQGELAHAIRLCDQGLALSRASGNRNMLPILLSGLGYAAALQGRLVEGHALLEEGICDSRRMGGLVALAHRVAWLSEICRRMGRGAEAEQHARQALDLALQQQDQGDEALALHQLGVIHAHADPPEVVQAETYYYQALTRAEELGMRPLVAHCHRSLGTLYAATGQREQARTALSTAIAMYQAMEMTFWLPETEAALAQVEGR
jgi:tetratricopeptide (TPR) repeat protein